MLKINIHNSRFNVKFVLSSLLTLWWHPSMWYEIGTFYAYNYVCSTKETFLERLSGKSVAIVESWKNVSSLLMLVCDMNKWNLSSKSVVSKGLKCLY